MSRFVFISICLSLIFASAPQTVRAQMHNLPVTGALNLETPIQSFFGPAELPRRKAIYGEQASISWSLFVPKTYDPANPPGILVYISPMPTGAPPKNWHSVLSDKNMIYISANGAGNRAQTNRRIADAILALDVVSQRYVVDEDKRILAGFSGGGRTASYLIESLPDAFDGVIFIGGAFKWKGEAADMERALSGKRFVFVTGRGDQARREVKSAFRQYRKVETLDAKLIDDRNLGHALPKTREFREALSFFDTP